MELLKLELAVASFFLVETLLDSLTAFWVRRRKAARGKARILVLDNQSRVRHRLKQISVDAANRRRA